MPPPFTWSTELEAGFAKKKCELTHICCYQGRKGKWDPRQAGATHSSHTRTHIKARCISPPWALPATKVTQFPFTEETVQRQQAAPTPATTAGLPLVWLLPHVNARSQSSITNQDQRTHPEEQKALTSKGALEGPLSWKLSYSEIGGAASPRGQTGTERDRSPRMGHHL